MEGKRPIRIAVVTPIPTPYRDGLWNVFSELPDVELEVFYCAAGKADRPWSNNWKMRYQHEFMKGWNLVSWWRKNASLFWNPAIGRRLREGRFDAVLIGGYNHFTMLRAMSVCRRQGIPYFLSWETHEQRSGRGIKSWLRNRLVAWVLEGAAGAFPTGSLSKAFLEQAGLASERSLITPNISDVTAIEKRAESLVAKRDELLRDFGLRTDLPTIVFVGRLISQKRATDLIAAVDQLGADCQVQVLIAGDGDERPALEKQAQGISAKDRIHFAGFVEPDQIERVYAAGDIFVLTSHETWGVVVLEALAAGLQVIVSDRVGSHADVRDQASVFPFRDVNALSAAIRVAIERVPTWERRAHLPAGWNHRDLARQKADHVRRWSKSATAKTLSSQPEMAEN